MKQATNEFETFENFREFVIKLDTLMTEFYEKQHEKIHIISFTDVLDLERLKEKGYPMWMNTKDNLLKIGNTGILIGLTSPFRQSGFVALESK